MQRQRMLLWLMIIVIAVASGLGAQQQPAPKTTFLDQLTPGQAVNLDEKEGRYEITVLPKLIRPLSHTVIEIGQDYVVLRDFVGMADTIIPVYAIKSIKIVRLSGK